MTDNTLTNSLLINPSQLYVRDLAKMSHFYREQVGLEVLETTNGRILLGDGRTAIVELVEKIHLTYASPRSAGLFHNAILFASRGTLSKTVGNLIVESPQLFTGTGDHLVSEAFYFDDPEGNGVELYFDRPMDTWQWNDGQVVMDTLYIDPLDYINQHASEKATIGKKLGHIHLRIGNIAEARGFYISLLGFNVTADIGSALFISIAGYHHHIGLNTWLSQGAGKRAPALGLSDVTITLESGADVTNLAARLEQVNYPFTFLQGKIRVSDPWGNTLVFTTK